MRKITLLLFCFSLAVLVSCSERNTVEEILTGNWYKNKNPENTISEQYSWGEGKTVINFTLEIDLYGDNRTIFLPLIGGPFKVTEITNVDKDQYNLTFYFDRGDFEVTYSIHYNDEDSSIWLELVTDRDLTFIPTGPDFLWYKIAGPFME